MYLNEKGRRRGLAAWRSVRFCVPFKFSFPHLFDLDLDGMTLTLMSETKLRSRDFDLGNVTLN